MAHGKGGLVVLMATFFLVLSLFIAENDQSTLHGMAQFRENIIENDSGVGSRPKPPKSPSNCHIVDSFLDCSPNGMCDTNYDGYINNYDVEYMVDFLSGKKSICGLSPCVCDLDNDSNVDIYDIELLQSLLPSQKDFSLYDEKEVFIISNNDWKDVLSLVPVTTWTSGDHVNTYPTLIYHTEGDIDSISLNHNMFTYLIDGEGILNGQPLEEYNFRYLVNSEISEVVYNGDLINIDFRFNYPFYGNSSFNLSNITIITPAFLIPTTLTSFEFNGTYTSADEENLSITYRVELSDAYDLDSIIYFLQQYAPSKITLVNGDPVVMDLLVADEPLGAGLSEDDINIITPEDYTYYWDNLNSIIVSEEDYATGLIASTYASLMNMPLTFDVPPDNLKSICIGNVQGNCDESFTVEEIHQMYSDITDSDKIIIVNPYDFNISVESAFISDKTDQPISKLYSGLSLASPFLASAKHELLIPTQGGSYEDIDRYIEQAIHEYRILSNGEEMEAHAKNQKMLYRRNLDTSDEEQIRRVFGYDTSFSESENSFIWMDGYMYTFDKATHEVSRVEIPFTEGGVYVDDKMVFVSNREYDVAKLILYDVQTDENTEIDMYESDNYFGHVAFDGRYILWSSKRDGVCEVTGNSCSGSSCVDMFCYKTSNLCTSDSDCEGELKTFCTMEDCIRSIKSFIYDTYTGEKEFLGLSDGLGKEGIVNGVVVYTEGSIIMVYDIASGQKRQLGEGYIINVGEDYALMNLLNSSYTKLGLYSFLTGEITIVEGLNIYDDKSQISQGKILYLNYDIGKCENSGDSCTRYSDCQKTCFNTGEPCINDTDCGKSFCQHNSCNPTTINVYDIESKAIQTINLTSPVLDFFLADNALYYISESSYDYIISGYLTIIGGNDAIPHYEDMGFTDLSNRRSLDHTQYADMDGDMMPDMSAGRIQGMTVSDVSSYIARSVFVDEINSKDSMKFLASSFDYMITHADSWSKSLNDIGYDSTCDIYPTYTSSVDYCNINENTLHWPSEWLDRDVVMYLDHGSPGWAGIGSDQIPYLSNSIVILDACSTCSTNDMYSFCTNAIRKGALATSGAVSVGWTGTATYMYVMDGIYNEDITMGEAFTKNYENDLFRYMTTLIADPTLKLSPNHMLEEPLGWEF